MLVGQCQQYLSGFLAKCHLPRVSCQSRLAANDRVIMRYYRGLRPNLLAFTLKVRKTPEHSARKQSDEGCATSHRHK